jgi:hypothetical protein
MRRFSHVDLITWVLLTAKEQDFDVMITLDMLALIFALIRFVFQFCLQLKQEVLEDQQMYQIAYTLHILT